MLGDEEPVHMKERQCMDQDIRILPLPGGMEGFYGGSEVGVGDLGSRRVASVSMKRPGLSRRYSARDGRGLPLVLHRSRTHNNLAQTVGMQGLGVG